MSYAAAPMNGQQTIRHRHAPSFTPARPNLLQRKCACGGTPGLDGECAECRKKRLQRRSAGRSEPSAAPPIVHETIRSPGQPLDAQTRAFMEPRLGHDFGHVRVHTGARAAESARAVDAHAYTVGEHVVFGAGQYAPQTTAGKTLLAHELAHVVQQQGAGTASSPVEISRADDRYEREAERAAGNVVGEVPVGTLAEAHRLMVSRIGGLGYAPDPRDELVRKQYREFIDNAERFGMPTRFLRAVARDYPILRGGGDFVNPVLNYMVLTEETMKSVAKMSPSLPYGEAGGIQTIYHESTHAYLDLASDEEKTAEAIKAGVAHYKDAPLRGGGRADDPERLFQEAAASYVGHRVATWWTALERLSLAAAGEIPPDKISEWVADARREYDAAMASRKFGYQETGGFLGIGTSQTETTRDISPQLKDFLDASILEGKIPDKFDDVAGFQELVARAMSRQASQGETVPPAQNQPNNPVLQRQSTSPHGELAVGAAPQYPDCDQQTSGVRDPAGIIKGAEATAIARTNAVIPMIGAVITAPESWQGTITSEHLDRHFHCPSDEQLDYIRTTLQAIGALLPELPLRCTNDPGLCRSSEAYYPVPYTYHEVLLCPEYFTLPADLRATNLILRVANMLGREGECYRGDPCYNDFSIPASTMVNNGTNYAYFAAEASGARSFKWPATLPCGPRQPATGTTEELPPQPQRLCQEAGRPTSRTIVFPRPPRRPFVQVGYGPASGRLLEERHDASGNFVCDRGRRIDQTW